MRGPAFDAAHAALVLSIAQFQSLRVRLSLITSSFITSTEPLQIVPLRSASKLLPGILIAFSTVSMLVFLRFPSSGLRSTALHLGRSLETCRSKILAMAQTVARTWHLDLRPRDLAELLRIVREQAYVWTFRESCMAQ